MMRVPSYFLFLPLCPVTDLPFVPTTPHPISLSIFNFSQCSRERPWSMSSIPLCIDAARPAESFQHLLSRVIIWFGDAIIIILPKRMYTGFYLLAGIVLLTQCCSVKTLHVDYPMTAMDVCGFHRNFSNRCTSWIEPSVCWMKQNHTPQETWIFEVHYPHCTRRILCTGAS